MSDLEWMRLALVEASKAIPLTTAFCVGCVIIQPGNPAQLISTGYSRELAGNTHAEANAIDKLFQSRPTEAATLLQGAHLYTTLEPCSVRLSGNIDCTKRILETGVGKVILGVQEPADFVQCEGVRLLREAGVEVCAVAGMEKDCLDEARRGH